MRFFYSVIKAILSRLSIYTLHENKTMAKDPFSPFDPVNGNPVTIVFGTFNYRNIIHKWINYAKSSCDHWRIICMDQELVGWLNEIGHGV